MIAAGLGLCVSHTGLGNGNVAGPHTMVCAEKVLTSLQKHLEEEALDS